MVFFVNERSICYYFLCWNYFLLLADISSYLRSDSETDASSRCSSSEILVRALIKLCALKKIFVCSPESTEIAISSSDNHRMETACVKWLSNNLYLVEFLLLLLLFFNLISMTGRHMWFEKQCITLCSKVFFYSNPSYDDRKHLSRFTFMKIKAGSHFPTSSVFRWLVHRSSKSLEL